MITRNDYNLRLFNGDIGIILPDPDKNGEPGVFFQGEEGVLRKFFHVSLPEHETVFAMTVHKSQGSEFERVLLILPDVESPALTRELIYTAITRAKKVLRFGGMKIFFGARFQDALIAHLALEKSFYHRKSSPKRFICIVCSFYLTTQKQVQLK